MFNLLFAGIQFSISIVYPLHQSFKCIEARLINDVVPWLIYWIVLTLVLNVQSFLSPLLRFIPFANFIKTYLLVWLVFPILDKREYKLSKYTNSNSNAKINGALVIWDFYIIPFLINFDSKLADFINLNLSNVKKLSVNLFNLVIDTWFNGNEKLKVFGSYNENSSISSATKDETKDESFMGSVYVMFKETKLIPSTLQSGLLPNSESAYPSNRNWTLLKSLLSLVPYGGTGVGSGTRAGLNATSLSTGLVPVGSPTARSSAVEDFDVVDVSDLRDQEDSDGSETSTGWFKWRNTSVSGTNPAVGTQSPSNSNEETKETQ